MSKKTGGTQGHLTDTRISAAGDNEAAFALPVRMTRSQ